MKKRIVIRHPCEFCIVRATCDVDMQCNDLGVCRYKVDQLMDYFGNVEKKRYKAERVWDRFFGKQSIVRYVDSSINILT
jgi:hypothetical protein